MTRAAICVRVVITGRVQGVGFRAWVQTKSQDLFLDGWVRNCADGAVEAVFSGNMDAVHRMLEACHFGPKGSQVDEVISQPVSAVALASGFFIKPNV